MEAVFAGSYTPWLPDSRRLSGWLPNCCKLASWIPNSRSCVIFLLIFLWSRLASPFRMGSWTPKYVISPRCFFLVIIFRTIGSCGCGTHSLTWLPVNAL